MNEDYLTKNLQRVHEWIKSADMKVSIFLAFEGVILNFLIPEIKLFYSNHSNNELYIFTALLVASSVLYSYSICKLIFALISRTQPGRYKQSLSFFGDIAKQSLKEYKLQIENAGKKDIENDLIVQTHTSSIIATKKHSAFRDSVWLFVCSMAILVLDIFYFIIWSAYAK